MTTIAVCSLFAFAGWAWGKYTGIRDGRVRGHYEMAVICADIRAAERMTDQERAEKMVREFWEQMNRHTNATIGGPSEPLRPIPAEPITDVHEKLKERDG